MIPQIIIAITIAAVGFGGAWQLQEWRYAAKEKDRVEQQLENERLASAAAIRRSEAVIKAQSAAAARSAALRRDADGARTALVGLRDATEHALRDAGASHDACLGRATSTGELLAQCGAAYQELGERADGHVSDIRTLMEAWPD